MREVRGKKYEKKRGVRVRMHPVTALFWVGLLMVDGSVYTALSLIASFLHEAGHLIAMRAAGVKPAVITVYPFGFDMQTHAALTSYRADLMIGGAGIVANLAVSVITLLLLPALQTAREEALFFLSANLALAVLNALPHPVLDGGTMLRSSLLLHMAPEQTAKICRLAGDITVLPLALGTLYLLFYSEGNPTLYLLCAYLVWTLVKAANQDR